MRIFLAGATGQMGKVVAEVVAETEHTVVAGYAAEEVTEFSFPLYQSLEEVQEEFDVVIDFSAPIALPSLVTFAKKRGKGIVIASTGHDETNEQLIQEASASIPIVYTGNLSVGIAVMQKVVETLARELQGFDIEIVEKHHRKKKDAPSGTAKMLYEAANQGRNGEAVAVEGRSGMTEGRTDEEIGISAVRGGTIVGEHTVLFAGLDEVVEVKHIATSKRIFAVGAVRATQFLLTKTNGVYSMREVLEA